MPHWARVGVASALLGATALAAPLAQQPATNVPVVFTFVGPQFDFESGRVVLFRLIRGADGGIAPLLTRPSRDPNLNLRNGETPAVDVSGAGPFQGMIHSLTVVRRNDGRRFDVGGVVVEGVVTEANLQEGRVTISIDAPQLLVIRTEDPDGRPLPNALVSVSYDRSEGSMEGMTRDNGALVLLGLVGRHTVRAHVSDRSARTTFEITPAETGERVIVLRIPNP